MKRSISLLIVAVIVNSSFSVIISGGLVQATAELRENKQSVINPEAKDGRLSYLGILDDFQLPTEEQRAEMRRVNERHKMIEQIWKVLDPILIVGPFMAVGYLVFFLKKRKQRNPTKDGKHTALIVSIAVVLIGILGYIFYGNFVEPRPANPIIHCRYGVGCTRLFG